MYVKASVATGGAAGATLAATGFGGAAWLFVMGFCLIAGALLVRTAVVRRKRG